MIDAMLIVLVVLASIACIQHTWMFIRRERRLRELRKAMDRAKQ